MTDLSAPTPPTERMLGQLASGRHPRYWIGRRRTDGALIVMDEDDFPPGNEAFTHVFVVDPDAGVVTAAGLEEPFRVRRASDPERDPQILARTLALFFADQAARRAEARARAREEEERRAQEVRRQQRLEELRDVLGRWIVPDTGPGDWRPPPRIGDEDIRLALEWYARADRDVVVPRLRAALRAGVPAFQLESGDVRPEVTRVVAARAAELVVAAYLEAEGHTVHDVAITQLRDHSTQAWQSHDFEVDPSPAARLPAFVRPRADGRVAVDVKSARRPSDRRGGGWLAVRQIVRKEKAGARDVALVGVIAPFLPLGRLLTGNDAEPHPRDGPPLWLVTGWTSLARLDAYQAWCRDGVLVLEVPGRDLGMLAPWAYETPPPVVAVAAVREAIESRLAPGETLAGALGLSDTQLTALSLTLDGAVDAPPIADPHEAEFVRMLRDGIARFGRVLPVLHLTVLKHFVAMLRRDHEPMRFHPARYVDLLWPYAGAARAGRRAARTDAMFRFPLGVSDPERTILTLVDALEVLWDGDRARLRRYEHFTLSGTSILRGRLAGAPHDETVLAYCGGVDEHGPCGVYPLIAGVAPHCTNGYLRCDCGYCCRACAAR